MSEEGTFDLTDPVERVADAIRTAYEAEGGGCIAPMHMSLLTALRLAQAALAAAAGSPSPTPPDDGAATLLADAVAELRQWHEPFDGINDGQCSCGAIPCEALRIVTEAADLGVPAVVSPPSEAPQEGASDG